MTLWLDLKERDDGGWVYQLYAKKTKKKENDQNQPSGISLQSDLSRSPDGSRGRSGTTFSSDAGTAQGYAHVEEGSQSKSPEVSRARQGLESSSNTSLAEDNTSVNPHFALRERNLPAPLVSAKRVSLSDGDCLQSQSEESGGGFAVASRCIAPQNTLK